MATLIEFNNKINSKIDYTKNKSTENNPFIR